MKQRIQMATKWCLTQLGMNGKAAEDLCVKSNKVHEREALGMGWSYVLRQD